MTARLCGFALLALLAAGCSPAWSPPSKGATSPSARCLNEPGRSENYSQDRPLFFLFCVQTP